MEHGNKDLLTRTEVFENNRVPEAFSRRGHKACVCCSCSKKEKTHLCHLLEGHRVASKEFLKKEMRCLEESPKQMQTTEGWLQAVKWQIGGDHAKLREQVTQLFGEMQDMLRVEEEAALALINNEEEEYLTQLELYSRNLDKKRECTDSTGISVKDKSGKERLDHVELRLEKNIMAGMDVTQWHAISRWGLDKAVIGQLKQDVQAALKNLGEGISKNLRQRKCSHVGCTLTTEPKSINRITPETTCVSKMAALTLDPNTAHPNILVSVDRLSAQWTAQPQARLPHPERFRLHPQVLCGQGLSEGAHSWQVEVGGARRWEVGVTCKSRDRSWVDSCIMWALRWDGRQLQAFEGQDRYTSPKLRSIRQAPNFIQVHLDCGQQTLSFFTVEGVCGEGLLHRFSVKPSGPLFPGFYLEESFMKITKYHCHD